jgi:hypothetical protein
MSTDLLVTAGSSITSGVTERWTTVAFQSSSTIDIGGQHRYPRYQARDETPGMTPATTTTARSIRRGAVIVAACLVEAILILGFVVASLGLGYESHSGVGPDQRPPPVRPAPPPPPDPPRISP